MDLATAKFIGLHTRNDTTFQRVYLCRILINIVRYCAFEDKSIIKYVDGIEDGNVVHLFSRINIHTMY